EQLLNSIQSTVLFLISCVPNDEEDDGVHLAPSSADDAPRIENSAQGSVDNANC
ncbi:hypothetical protein Tco_0022262, partial [Tanacetum coccineum]